MTTKYFKITNKADLVSRINLEKLGLSTKRNDPSTIGQFGSGIKFAPIAALRNGWEWWFTGTDNGGEYKMRYATDVEDGIECIVYDYGDYRKSSSFTIDAGSLSWITPFQIYREAIANAFDEASNSEDWSVTIVDASEIKPVSGEFSVYITAAPELVQIHNNFDKYFAINREILTSVGASSDRVDFMPSYGDGIRIYSHKVLVHESLGNSVFDYNIDSAKLNEERTLASLWSTEWSISVSLATVSDQSICAKVINAAQYGNGEPFELERFGNNVLNYHKPNLAWFDAFVEIYGENCAIYNNFADKFGVKESIKLRGYKPVLIYSDNLFNILKAAEVRTYLDIVNEDFHLNADYDISKYENLTNAINIASSFIPELNDLVASQRLGVFTSDLDRNLGMTIGVDKEKDERKILINSDHVDDVVENIVATIVHEYDHLSSGWRDDDYRQFRDLADRRIAKLMMKFHVTNFFELRDGVLVFPLSKIAHIGSNMTFEIASTNTLSIIRIGDKHLYTNNDIVCDGPLSGVLTINNTADSFVIPGLSNVKIVGVINV